jgi:hypothetical protein
LKSFLWVNICIIVKIIKVKIIQITLRTWGLIWDLNKWIIVIFYWYINIWCFLSFINNFISGRIYSSWRTRSANRIFEVVFLHIFFFIIDSRSRLNVTNKSIWYWMNPHTNIQGMSRVRIILWINCKASRV